MRIGRKRGRRKVGKSRKRSRNRSSLKTIPMRVASRSSRGWASSSVQVRTSSTTYRGREPSRASRIGMGRPGGDDDGGVVARRAAAGGGHRSIRVVAAALRNREGHMTRKHANHANILSVGPTMISSIFALCSSSATLTVRNN